MKHMFFLAGFLASMKALAFCGFYVAKADAKLFNKTSEVVLVRNGDKSTITMSSDFQGDVKDFAMVVPVPVVLQKEQVKIVEHELIRKLDDYSGPRLVSYNDVDPCYQPPHLMFDSGTVMLTATGATTCFFSTNGASVANVVKIEAKYSVGEYDILVLSSKESGALETWLNVNGYKIPAGAKEVLDPYIKSNMKFFVVKANTDEMKRLGTNKLRPIQISFNSPKFMLPIRLGMANATDTQDMLVYAFSKVGRVEVTNYRTVEMPTGQDIPLFVEPKFGAFYKDIYSRTYAKEGKNAVMLEYAWDISGSVSQFCDPCVGAPPMLQDLMTLGVDWVQQYHTGYQGQIYFTRLHTTYDRAHFPQDLQFQETPNKANYQARYVLHRPPASNFDCDKAAAYIIDLQKRRQGEMKNLSDLAGWNLSEYREYSSEYNQYIRKSPNKTIRQGSLFPGTSPENFPLILLSLISLAAVIFTLTRRPANVMKP